MKASPTSANKIRQGPIACVPVRGDDDGTVAEPETVALDLACAECGRRSRAGETLCSTPVRYWFRTEGAPEGAGVIGSVVTRGRLIDDRKQGTSGNLAGAGDL